MKYSIIPAVLLLITSGLFAQVKEEEKVSVTIGGFVRTDVIFDSRQNEAVREGYFLRYPLKEEKDKNGDDMNAAPSLGMFSIHSRLSAKVTGPAVLGAKPTGYFEGDFFGPTDASVNAFRMRHYFLELKWASTALMIGQYWHPLMVPEAIPGTVSTNTGSPMQVFSRVPQIKLTQNFSDLAVVFTLASQRDYGNEGPSGTSASYLKNAILPELNLLAQFGFGKSLIGAGANFKSIMPRTRTTKGYKTDERLNSIAAMAYAKLVVSDLTVSARAMYGQNLSNLSMLGGYGVKSLDTTNGRETYTNINTMSVWTDLSYGKAVKAGLFAGYTKNLGADDELVSVASLVWGRGKDIDNILRISPRLVWDISKLRLAGEYEYTAAAYGKTQKDGKVTDAKTVANNRVVMSVFYYF